MKILISGAILVAILTAAFFSFMPTKSAPALASNDVGNVPPASQLARDPPNAPALAFDEVVYVPRLPNPADLANNRGAPDGATVSKIVQTRIDITVTYAFANGLTRVVFYRLLPSSALAAETDGTRQPQGFDAARTAGPVVYQQPAPIYYNYSAPSNTAVYQEPAPVYYDANPAYTVIYQQPVPVYDYVPTYGYGYYQVYSTRVLREGRGGGFGGVGRSESHGYNHEGFRGVGGSDGHVNNRGGGRR